MEAEGFPPMNMAGGVRLPRLAVLRHPECSARGSAKEGLGPRGHARKNDVFGDGRDRRLPLTVIALQLRDLASLGTEVVGIVHRPLDLTGSRRQAGVVCGGDHVAIVANPNRIGSAAAHEQQEDENCVSHAKTPFCSPIVVSTEMSVK